MTSTYREAVAMIADTGDLDVAVGQQPGVVTDLGVQIRAHINRNASMAQDQTEYGAEHDALAQQYGEANAKLADLDNALRERQGRYTELLTYLNRLESTGELASEFDERLWNLAVKTVTVQRDGVLVFRIKDGREVEWR